MCAKLHVGNLSHTVRDAELRRLFTSHGLVRTTCVLDQLKTGASTASGLVEMDSKQEADVAIAALNGQVCHGRALIVCWATPRQADARKRSRAFDSVNVPHAPPTS